MYGLKQVARSQITEHQGLGEQASKHQTRVIWPPTTTQPVTMLENSSGVESCLSSLLLYPVDQDIDDLLVQLHFLLCSFRDKVSGKCFLQKEIHYEHFPGYKRCKLTVLVKRNRKETVQGNGRLCLSAAFSLSFASAALATSEHCCSSSFFLLSLTASLQVVNSFPKRS